MAPIDIVIIKLTLLTLTLKLDLKVQGFINKIL